MVQSILYPSHAGWADAGQGSLYNGHSWDALHDGDIATIEAAGGAVVVSEIASGVAQIVSAGGSGWWRLSRIILLIPTNSLPNQIVISSATLSLYCPAKGDTLNTSPSVNVYDADTAGESGFVQADFNSFGTLPFATAINYSNVSTGSYVDFSLNSSGIAAINTSGVSKFGIRLVTDVLDNEPTWAAESGSWFTFALTGTNKPKLTVNYILAETYPTDAATRVTSIKHVYKNALINGGKTTYKCMIQLGGLPALEGFDAMSGTSMEEEETRPESDYNGKPIWPYYRPPPFMVTPDPNAPRKPIGPNLGRPGQIVTPVPPLVPKPRGPSLPRGGV